MPEDEGSTRYDHTRFVALADCTVQNNLRPQLLKKKWFILTGTNIIGLLYVDSSQEALGNLPL